jgi:hypothetical protein
LGAKMLQALTRPHRLAGPTSPLGKGYSITQP